MRARHLAIALLAVVTAVPVAAGAATCPLVSDPAHDGRWLDDPRLDIVAANVKLTARDVLVQVRVTDLGDPVTHAAFGGHWSAAFTTGGAQFVVSTSLSNGSYAWRRAGGTSEFLPLLAWFDGATDSVHWLVPRAHAPELASSGITLSGIGASTVLETAEESPFTKSFGTDSASGGHVYDEGDPACF